MSLSIIGGYESLQRLSHIVHSLILRIVLVDVKFICLLFFLAFKSLTKLFPCFFVLCQAAKKIYESLLGDGVNATTLAHIQVHLMLLVLNSSVGYFVHGYMLINLSSDIMF